PYIRYRVHAAGYQGDKLFDPGAVEKIALYSEGIPRLINTLCDNALREAYVAGSKRVTGAMAEEVVRDLDPSFSQRAPRATYTAEKEFKQESPWKISQPEQIKNATPSAEPWKSKIIRLVEPEALATPDQRSNLKGHAFTRETIARLRRFGVPA